MAVQFTQSNSEYLHVDSSPVTDVPLSMSCLFNSDNSGARQTLMWNGDKDSGSHYFMLWLDGADQISTNAVVATERSGNEGQATSSGSYTAGTWHQGGAVYTSHTSRTAYIDGAAGSPETTDTGVINASDRISIGRAGDNSPDWYMDGKIAEAAIWNVALTDAEMAILGAGKSPLFVRPGSLVFYDRLIRLDAGDDTHDMIGGRTMTGFGVPTNPGIHPRIIMPSEDEMVFVAAGGITEYTRTLSAEVGLAASMVRAAAYARTLTASPEIGLTTPTITQLLNHVRNLVAEIGIDATLARLATYNRNLNAELGLATPAITAVLNAGTFSRTLSAAVGLNASGAHEWVHFPVWEDRDVAQTGTDREVENLY